MATPTPSLQWCIPGWSTSLAGRKVRPAVMTKWQAQAAEEEQRRLRPKLFGAKE